MGWEYYESRIKQLKLKVQKNTYLCYNTSIEHMKLKLTYFSFLILLGLFLFSFQQQEFKPETFKEFPEDIDGCSCYFSETKEQFRSGETIYVDNMKDKAFFKINGAFQELKFIRSNEKNSTKMTKIYSNDTYNVVIEVKKSGQLDETTQYSGSITIQSTKGVILYKHAIFGECGC